MQGPLGHEDVLVVGDDKDAEEKVAALVVDHPAAGIDGGVLRLARQLEPLTAVLININRRYKTRSGVSVSAVRGMILELRSTSRCRTGLRTCTGASPTRPWTSSGNSVSDLRGFWHVVDDRRRIYYLCAFDDVRNEQSCSGMPSGRIRGGSS